MTPRKRTTPSAADTAEAAKVLRRVLDAIEADELDASPALATGLAGAATALEETSSVHSTTD